MVCEVKENAIKTLMKTKSVMIQEKLSMILCLKK